MNVTRNDIEIKNNKILLNLGYNNHMSIKTLLTKEEILHLAKLAGLTLNDSQLRRLPNDLSSVIEYMSKIKTLDTTGIKETSQVTNLKNVFREDMIEKERMLTQEEALSNAKNTLDGYFKVKAIFNN